MDMHAANETATIEEEEKRGEGGTGRTQGAQGSGRTQVSQVFGRVIAARRVVAARLARRAERGERQRAVAEVQEEAVLMPSRAMALLPRVLIIDDDEDLLQVARRVLGEDGYLVDVAYTAMDGIHKALRFPPDAIVLDVLMSGCDGMEIFDTLKHHERTRGVPVLALSALAGRDAARLLLEAGFAALIEKPVNWPVLRRELRCRAPQRTI